MTYLPTAFEALEDLGPTSAVGLSRGPRATLVPPPSSQPSRSDRERLEVLLEAGPALSHARGAEGLEGILRALPGCLLPGLGELALIELADLAEPGDEGGALLAHHSPEEPPRFSPIPTSLGVTLSPCPGSAIHTSLTAARGLDALARLGATSAMVVPLVSTRGRRGALAVASLGGRHYGALDLRVLEAIALHAGSALESAVLHRDARDATRRAEEAGRQIELASRAKDELLGVVSHELRTPLTAVLGWAKILRGRVDPALLAKGLAAIDRNARAQTKLIEDLLDVSRIITGKLGLEPRPVELDGVVRAAIDVVRHAADAKGVELAVSLEDQGPVAGDPDRLQQVVWNLVSNAVKFTPSGGHVAVTLARRGAFAEVRVIDTGRGIDEAFLPFVFERFRQADSSPTRRYGGLGLGLSIVRHLVELHGGMVSAESDGPGRGSTFTVRLPLREGIPAAAAGLPRETDPGPAHARLDGLRVLVVDDEADARDLLATLLGTAGAVSASAGSAAEALRLVEAFQPDVLVSDVGMPGEDGYGLIRRLRASGGAHARIPALALTAYAGPEDANRALLAGFSSHLPKPAAPAVVITAIATLAGLAALGELTTS